MPRVHLVSFYGAADPGDDYPERQRHLHDTAARVGGVDVQHPWNQEQLRATDYYTRHRAILDQPRGAGFWLWKPWLILKLLEEIPENDFLLYHDVGRALSRKPGIGYQFRRPVTPLVEWADDNGGIFAGIHVPVYGRNARWTKRDCFVLMDCDEHRFWETPLIQAGMNVWKNTAVVRDFVATWRRYCEDPRILTDQPNQYGLENFPDFQDHRHDQSVLTNLVLKYDLPLFNPPPGEIFKQRDIDYIARRAAVDKLVAGQHDRGRASLQQLAATLDPPRSEPNAVACYQLHLEEDRGRELSVLEIAHSANSGYALWHDYLPDSTIASTWPGADPDALEPALADRVTLHSLNPTHRPSLELFCRQRNEEGDRYHLIILRGATSMRDQQMAIGVLFPMLRPGGHLLVENMETSRTDSGGSGSTDLLSRGQNSTLNLVRRINIPEFRFSSHYFTLEEVRFLERHADTAGVHWSPDRSTGIGVFRRRL